jgi:hypothetical protein
VRTSSVRRVQTASLFGQYRIACSQLKLAIIDLTNPLDNDIMEKRAHLPEGATFADLVRTRGPLLSILDLVEFMKEFDIQALLDATQQGAYFEGMARGSEGGPFLDDEATKRGGTAFIEMLTVLDCPATAASLERLIDSAASRLRGNDFTAWVNEQADLYREFRRNFAAEAGRSSFFCMERDRIHFWNEPTRGWDHILAALPQEATDDVTEAGKCFACSRYTACVHHLCRVLECGFKAFAVRKNVTLKFPEQTSWEQLKRDLKDYFDLNKSTMTTEDIAAFSKVREQVTVMAPLWRNPTAHSTGTFHTDEQALAIYHAVRQLMGDLVKL